MYSQILNIIKEYQTIIIHRHGRPDGDALGSQIGLKESIKETFPNKEVYVVGDVSQKLKFIGEMDIIDDDKYQNALVIVLDCSDITMICDERYKLGNFIIKIDHHIPNTQNSDYGHINIVETNEVSCASLLAKIIFANDMKLTSSGAKALFTGIVTDSGRFRYDSVTSSTFNIAARLLEYNFNLNDIYNNLYIEDWNIVLLRSELLMKVQFTKHGVAFFKNTLEDVEKYNVDFFTISRGMVNIMSGIKNIDIWANFTENDQGKVIVEIRSSKYNINDVAVKYGGGGHKMASGATLDNFLVADELIKDLEKILEENNGI